MTNRRNIPETRQGAVQSDVSPDLKELFDDTSQEWFSAYNSTSPKAVEFHFNSDLNSFKKFALVQLKKIVKIEPDLQTDEVLVKLKAKLDETLDVKAAEVKSDLLMKQAKILPSRDDRESY